MMPPKDLPLLPSPLFAAYFSLSIQFYIPLVYLSLFLSCSSSSIICLRPAGFCVIYHAALLSNPSQKIKPKRCPNWDVLHRESVSFLHQNEKLFHSTANSTVSDAFWIFRPVLEPSRRKHFQMSPYPWDCNKVLAEKLKTTEIPFLKHVLHDRNEFRSPFGELYHVT